MVNLAYISGSITYSPNWEDTRSKFDQTEKILNVCGYEVFQPYKATQGLDHSKAEDRQRIYDIDTTSLSKSTLIVAYLDEPSFGAGYEVCYAMDCGISVISIFKASNSSPFMLGCLEKYPWSSIILYERLHDAWIQLAVAADRWRK